MTIAIYIAMEFIAQANQVMVTIAIDITMEFIARTNQVKVIIAIGIAVGSLDDLIKQ